MRACVADCSYALAASLAGHVVVMRILPGAYGFQSDFSSVHYLAVTYLCCPHTQTHWPLATHAALGVLVLSAAVHGVIGAERAINFLSKKVVIRCSRVTISHTQGARG